MAYLLPASLRHSHFIMNKLKCTASSLAFVRTFSAEQSTDMVSQMVQFARATCQANPQQALDVLQTGLGHQEGAGRNRLHLAIAEVQAGRSNWAAVEEHAGKVAFAGAKSAMPASAAQMQAEASAVCVRALLIQGHDQQAMQLAQQAVQHASGWFAEADLLTRQQAQLQATAGLASAQHAVGDKGAEATCQTALAMIEDGQVSADEGHMSAATIAAALKQAASLRLAQGSLDEARDLYSKASTAAQTCLTSTDDTGLMPASATQELAADALLGSAQVAIAQKAWEEAEQHLSKALSIAEQANGEVGKHPTVGMILGLLGHVYARSKRITLAEGLHRQAMKLLQLNEADHRQIAPLCVHSSLAAAAAWRYAQLLTALPKRETEASLWKNFAEHQHLSSKVMAPLSEALGPLELLKGQDDGSRGVVLDLALRRALPCF